MTQLTVLLLRGVLRHGEVVANLVDGTYLYFEFVLFLTRSGYFVRDREKRREQVSRMCGDMVLCVQRFFLRWGSRSLS